MLQFPYTRGLRALSLGLLIAALFTGPIVAQGNGVGSTIHQPEHPLLNPFRWRSIPAPVLPISPVRDTSFRSAPRAGGS